MRLLLDTHTLLWFLADDRRLRRNAYAIVPPACVAVRPPRVRPRTRL